MPRSPGFQGTLTARPKALHEVAIGNWYFGFDCLVCSKRFAVFDDESGGKIQRTFSGSGHVLVACPHCAAQRLYASDQVRQFEAP
jgi:hypothetical protein